MRRSTKTNRIVLLVPLVFLLIAFVVLAQDGGGYDLSWWTVDGGGGHAGAGSPGQYALDATIGQPDAGVWQGGGYTLVGGFWGSSAEQPINMPPTLSGLPDQLFDHTASPPGTIDLYSYASDGESATSELTYTVEGPPPAGAGVWLEGNRYVHADPSPNWCGGTDVTVRATDPGGLWDTDTFRVAVSWSCPGPVEMPGAPVLIAPVDGGTAHSDAPTFAWHPVEGAEGYQVQVDEDARFSSPARDETTFVTEFVLPMGLSGGIYRWRVRAVNGNEPGDWSEGWAFTVLDPSLEERMLYLPIVMQDGP